MPGTTAYASAGARVGMQLASHLLLTVPDTRASILCGRFRGASIKIMASCCLASAAPRPDAHPRVDNRRVRSAHDPACARRRIARYAPPVCPEARPEAPSTAPQMPMALLMPLTPTTTAAPPHQAPSSSTRRALPPAPLQLRARPSPPRPQTSSTDFVRNVSTTRTCLPHPHAAWDLQRNSKVLVE